VLSITCDNGLCNDTMIDELVDLLASFQGKANQTRCFLHIISLVAKSVIRQFDVAKGKVSEALGEAEEVLHALAEGIDLEDLETQREREDDNNDDVNSWVDKRNALSMADCKALDASVCPVKLGLMKVNSGVFDMNNLTHLIPTAAQNHIFNHPLHNTSVASVVSNTRTVEIESTKNAPQCDHSMEFNI
jgi:hypothetical protein